MVEADGKHRRDGHAGAGLENQHDHRHHTGDTQQREHRQCCRRDNEQPQAQREKEILILQQLFQVAGRDGRAGDNHGQRRVHVADGADWLSQDLRHRHTAQVEHQAQSHRQDAGAGHDAVYNFLCRRTP